MTQEEQASLMAGFGELLPDVALAGDMGDLGFINNMVRTLRENPQAVAQMRNAAMVVVGQNSEVGRRVAIVLPQLLRNEAVGAGQNKARIEFLKKLPNIARELKGKYADIASNVLDGNLQIIDETLIVHKGWGTAQTEVKFVQAADKKASFIKNFDGNKLDTKKPLVVTKLQLLYSASASAGDMPTASELATFATAEYPNILKSAYFEIKYNNSNIFEELPVRSTFDVGADNYDVNKKYGVFELESPILIMPDTAFEINLKTPAGAPAASTLALAISGASVMTRSNA